MSYRRGARGLAFWAVAAAALTITPPAEARAHHGHGHGHGMGWGGGGFGGAGGLLSMQLGAVGGGFGYGGFGYGGFGYWSTVGPNGPVIFPTPGALFRMGFMPAVLVNNAPLGGPMPPAPAPAANPQAMQPARRVDAAKVGQLVTIGDRLFRAGNTKRASERYEQAARADADSAAPLVRLAQVALVRGQFAEAAARIRAAVTADPRWLTNAPDIQRIYAEPADFARQIAKLESRVSVEPGDRDAWLVLGAELYLSGQTRRASDVFLRLSDRPPDPALAAFLDATTPAPNAQK